MAIPKKGLQDIRTLSGSIEQVFLPYKAYMKLACLEMEKARRGKERESAVHRVENIDNRFKEIDSEKGALLRALDGKEEVKGCIGISETSSEAESRKSPGGFRLRY